MMPWASWVTCKSHDIKVCIGHRILKASGLLLSGLFSRYLSINWTALSTTVAEVKRSIFMAYACIPIETACSLSLSNDSSLLAISNVFPRILSNPTMHFWYSNGSFSSMYFLMFCLASCFRYWRSLLTVPSPTCNILAIWGWLLPWLDSSKTLLLRHCILSTSVFNVSNTHNGNIRSFHNYACWDSITHHSPLCTPLV